MSNPLNLGSEWWLRGRRGRELLCSSLPHPHSCVRCLLVHTFPSDLYPLSPLSSSDLLAGCLHFLLPPPHPCTQFCSHSLQKPIHVLARSNLGPASDVSRCYCCDPL